MDFCGLQVAEYSILAVFVLIALCNQPLRPHRLQTALYPHLFLANVKTMPPTKGIGQFFLQSQQRHVARPIHIVGCM